MIGDGIDVIFPEECTRVGDGYSSFLVENANKKLTHCAGYEEKGAGKGRGGCFAPEMEEKGRRTHGPNLEGLT
jgi:hypothetical protein